MTTIMTINPGDSTIKTKQNKSVLVTAQKPILADGRLGHPLNTHRVFSCFGVRKSDARVCSVQVKEGKKEEPIDS